MTSRLIKWYMLITNYIVPTVEFYVGALNANIQLYSGFNLAYSTCMLYI